MKKFLALLMAALMMLSCVAFAEETKEYQSSLTTMENVNSTFKNSETTSGKVKTELWLQVEASGQIDVTVPLVLIFKTNIDGGSATSPDAYKITNNSTADVAVTSIAITKEAGSANNPMTMVNYSTETLGEDQYKAQMTVEQAKIVGATANGTWDLNAELVYTKGAIEGGLFVVAQPSETAGANETKVQVDMTTGALSFVTSHNNENKLDTTKGVKLLTVAYTVAIKTQGGVGADITNTSETLSDINATHTHSYTQPQG